MRSNWRNAATAFRRPATPRESAMSPEHFASDGFHPHEQSCEQWASGLLALWPPTLDVGGRRATSGGRRERRVDLDSGRSGQMLPVVQPGGD